MFHKIDTKNIISIKPKVYANGLQQGTLITAIDNDGAEKDVFVSKYMASYNTVLNAYTAASQSPNITVSATEYL